MLKKVKIDPRSTSRSKPNSNHV